MVEVSGEWRASEYYFTNLPKPTPWPRPLNHRWSPLCTMANELASPRTRVKNAEGALVRLLGTQPLGPRTEPLVNARLFDPKLFAQSDQLSLDLIDTVG